MLVREACPWSAAESELCVFLRKTPAHCSSPMIGFIGLRHHVLHAAKALPNETSPLRRQYIHRHLQGILSRSALQLEEVSLELVSFGEEVRVLNCPKESAIPCYILPVEVILRRTTSGNICRYCREHLQTSFDQGFAAASVKVRRTFTKLTTAEPSSILLAAAPGASRREAMAWWAP